MIPTKFTTPLTGLDWLERYEPHSVWHPAVDLNYYVKSGWDDLGQEVIAPRNGFVVYVHETTWNSSGFGKFIILLHSDGNYSRYAHLNDVTVKEGQEVKEGKIIGHVGNTGTNYPHLHTSVFGEKLAGIQKKHWRPWRFYPAGKTKQWVMEHYINPWTWWEKKEDKTLALFEMINQLKTAGLMHENTGINSVVPVKEMRKFLNFFLDKPYN